MIIGHLSGDAEMMLRIKSRSVIVRDELRTALRREGIRVLGLVKLKVSGPVLKNRTGTLRRKLNEILTESPDEMSESVGLNLSYAHVHEYGFDGAINVRAHMRTITQAFGRPLAAPVTFEMPEHPRHMTMPVRSYLRSTLREESPAIRDALRAAVRRAFT